MLIYQDNHGTIALANNPVHHARAKHIDIRAHFIRDLVERGTVTLTYISTDFMVADALTKGLPRPKFQQHSSTLLGDNAASTTSSSGGVGSSGLPRWKPLASAESSTLETSTLKMNLHCLQGL